MSNIEQLSVEGPRLGGQRGFTSSGLDKGDSEGAWNTDGGLCAIVCLGIRLSVGGNISVLGHLVKCIRLLNYYFGELRCT